MHKRNLSLIFLGFLFCTVVFCTVVSCEDDGEEQVQPKDSKYFILNGDSQDEEEKKGRISVYSYPSDVEKVDILDYESSVPMDWFYSAALIKDNIAYVTTRRADDVVKVSLNDHKVITSKASQFDRFVKDDKSMNLYSNHLIIGFSRSKYINEPGSSYLKFFDANTLEETDSVFLLENFQIIDTELIGTKLYISFRGYNNLENKLWKWDLATKQVEEEISFARFSQLYVGLEGGLFAFSGENLWKLDPATLNLLQVESFYGVNDFLPNVPSFAVDEMNNMVYFFRNAAQPAPYPFLLSSFNLSTKEEKVLVDFDDPPVGVANILLDGDREELIIADKNKLLFLDLKGEFIREKALQFNINKMVLH